MITFGVLAMVASVVRVSAVYQRFFAWGMQPDDPTVAMQASQELTRMDLLYTPVFLGVATLVSALVAGVFAWRRPRSPSDLPPPLPGEQRAETR